MLLNDIYLHLTGVQGGNGAATFLHETCMCTHSSNSTEVRAETGEQARDFHNDSKLCVWQTQNNM